MTLTSSQMIKIMVEVLNKKELTILGEEADAYRKHVEEDIVKAEAKGLVYEIPIEWEVEGA